MTSPLVSVVMSVYNSEKYLEDAIESILNQSYSNFEFIIINDGSTDSCLEIIKTYAEIDERILLVSRQNKGLPFSLNEAIEKSKGKYIARMDADDISLASRLKEQVSFMESNHDVGVCGTWCEVFGKNLKAKILKHPLSHDELKVRLLFSVCFAHPTVMMRKSVLDENDLKYNVEYVNAQDYELWSRLSEVTKLANLPRVLLKYRVVEDGITAIANRNKQELRYKLISSTFARHLKILNVDNTDKENLLHFTLGLNERIERECLELSTLNKYLIKLANTNNNIYLNKKYLEAFLYKKFLIASYFGIKKNRSFECLKYAFFYRGVYQIILKKVFLK